MKQWWITDEQIATFTCSTAEFKNIKLRNLLISFFPNKLSKTIELKKNKRAIIRTLSKKNWLMFLKLITMRTTRNTLGSLFREKLSRVQRKFLFGLFLQKVHENFFSNFVRKGFGWSSQIDRYRRVRIINLRRIGTLKTSKHFPPIQKLAPSVSLRRFPSTPEWENGQHTMQEGTKANDFLLFWFFMVTVAGEIMARSAAGCLTTPQVLICSLEWGLDKVDGVQRHFLCFLLIFNWGGIS